MNKLNELEEVLKNELNEFRNHAQSYYSGHGHDGHDYIGRAIFLTAATDRFGVGWEIKHKLILKQLLAQIENEVKGERK